MTIDTKNKVNTLGDWAALAIEKHFNKILKHEADVLADRDPEALHQMRVGMRRLRSAMTGFAPAMELPKPAQEKQVGKIARKLGMLRDLDVLQEVLQNKYKPKLPSAEQKLLETALDDLGKQRRQVLVEVKETLEGDRYKSLKQSITKWLKQPKFRTIAQMPIQEVLPDLLLPEISKLLLHPGWLVGTEVDAKEVKTQEKITPEIVKRQLLEQGPLLHSLRKETKRTRYQMEVFSDFYSGSYEAYLKDVKSIQEILGQLQDSFVLSEFLADALQSKLKNTLPTLAKKLTKEDYQAWLQWQTLQRRFLNLEIRKGFHVALLQPTGNSMTDGKALKNLN